MMEQNENSIEREMKRWEAREQRFAKLFSASILQSRAFKKEKVRHLRKLTSQYRWSNDPEERMARKLLNQERRQLEKELYPNRLKRNFMRFMGSLGRLADAIIKPPAGRMDMGKAVTDLKRAGFGDMKESLRQHRGKGQDTFSITDVRKLDKGQQLEYRPEFRKGQDGQLHYEGHTVTLRGEGKTVSYRMDAGDMRLGERQAKNLLSGRAVLVKGEWLKLDRNDKDAAGNLRIKRSPEINGPDLERELSLLPIRENRFAVTKAELIEALKQGFKVAVNMNTGNSTEVVYLASNGKSLDLFNAGGKKTTLSEILGTGQDKKENLSTGAAIRNEVKNAVPLNKGLRLVR